MKKIIDNAGPIIFGLLVLLFAFCIGFALSKYAKLNAQCYNACYPNVIISSNDDFCVCAPEKIIWRKDIK